MHMPLARGQASARRQYDTMPCFIVDDHNEILKHIYRAIGSGHLPFEGITLVHFDSHPDLSVPDALAADCVRRPAELFSQISIADFILPAVYAGHISRVIWLRTVHCEAFGVAAERELLVHVGCERASGLLRVCCDDEHYDETCVDSLDQFSDYRTLSLQIVTVPAPARAAAGAPAVVLRLTAHVIVDVCLDFFAVNNPFLLEVTRDFSRDAYDALAAAFRIDTDALDTAARRRAGAVFSDAMRALLHERWYRIDSEPEFLARCAAAGMMQLYASPDDASAVLGRLRRALQAMEDALCDDDNDDNGGDGGGGDCAGASDDASDGGGNSSCSEGAQPMHVCSGPTFGDAKKPSRLCTVYRDPANATALCMSSVMLAGSMHSLPHHASSPAEIDALLAQLRCVLAAPGMPRPVLCTMARSTGDEYTPPTQADALQEAVLDELSAMYGALRLTLDYAQPVVLRRPRALESDQR